MERTCRRRLGSSTSVPRKSVGSDTHAVAVPSAAAAAPRHASSDHPIALADRWRLVPGGRAARARTFVLPDCTESLFGTNPVRRRSASRLAAAEARALAPTGPPTAVGNRCSSMTGAPTSWGRSPLLWSSHRTTGGCATGRSRKAAATSLRLFRALPTIMLSDIGSSNDLQNRAVDIVADFLLELLLRWLVRLVRGLRTHEDGDPAVASGGEFLVRGRQASVRRLISVPRAEQQQVHVGGGYACKARLPAGGVGRGEVLEPQTLVPHHVEERRKVVALVLEPVAHGRDEDLHKPSFRLGERRRCPAPSEEAVEDVREVLPTLVDTPATGNIDQLLARLVISAVELQEIDELPEVILGECLGLSARAEVQQHA